MTEKPLVSIGCLTYNHAPYIRQCIEGFLMQNTDFPFEIIINDDCSTDGTTEIIKEYEKQYPNLINAIYHSENQFSKGVKGMFNKYVFPVAQGKYMAICEGDDYWTDPLKLQKQVDFLENHPDYTMCFHDVDIKAELGRDSYDVFGKLEDKDYDAFEDIVTWCVPTGSMLFKKEMTDKIPSNSRFTMGDNVIVLSCGQYGRIRCIPKKMGVYRLTSSGWIGSQSAKIQRYKYISHYYGLIESFPSCQNEKMYEILQNQYFQLLTILKREGNMEEFERVKFQYLENFPVQTHIELFNKYYRIEQVRYYTKKVLGKNFSKLVSKLRAYFNGMIH